MGNTNKQGVPNAPGDAHCKHTEAAAQRLRCRQPEHKGERPFPLQLLLFGRAA